MTKLTKRLRYEILRRDGHTCRYCGGKAPDVELHVDHVIPQALGGTNDPGNLVAACKDCNSGKASIPVDAELVADADATAVVFAQAMAQAREQMEAERDKTARLHADFDALWLRWGWTDRDGNRHPVARDDDWQASIDNLVSAGATLDDFAELVDVAMKSQADDVWRYFCGCCWTRIRQLQATARRLVNDGDVVDDAYAAKREQAAAIVMARRGLLDEPEGGWPPEDADEVARLRRLAGLDDVPDRRLVCSEDPEDGRPSPLPAATVNPHANCRACDGNRWLWDEDGVRPCPATPRNLELVPATRPRQETA